MANSIQTYWAKRVNIQALRGHKFEFNLNLKNEDGSEYNIPDGHVAFFGVFQKPQNNFFAEPIYYSDNPASNQYYSFPTEINNNTISVSLTSNNSGSSFEHENLYTAPGLYEYVLFTYDPANVPDITYPSEDEMPDNQYLNVEYIHPEAEQIFTVYPQTQNNGVGYYHEWFMMNGDSTLQPYCIEPDAVSLMANVSEGQAQIDPVSIYNQSYYSDSANIWNENSFVFSEGMNSLSVRVGIQTKNICRCIYPTEDTIINTNIWRSNYVETPAVSSAHELTTKEDIEFDSNHKPVQAGGGVMYIPESTDSSGAPIDSPAYSVLNTIEWPKGTPWHLTDPSNTGWPMSSYAISEIQGANNFPVGDSTSQYGIPNVSAGDVEFGIYSYLTNDKGWNISSNDITNETPQKDLYIPEANHYSSMTNNGFVYANWMLSWVTWSYINSEFFEYTGYYNQYVDEPVQGEFSWHTAGSVFYGFVDYQDEDTAQSFMNQNPQQWINTLPGVEAQVFLESDTNIFFSTLDYQKPKSEFKVRLKSAIVNAGHRDIWLQQTSESIINAINNSENFISIRYGMRLSSDNSVEISLTKQVHIEPVFYTETDIESFIFNQSSQLNYSTYNNLDDVPQNLDVVLDFNPIAADMQSQYPGQKVEMFYEHVDLITTTPFVFVENDTTYLEWQDILQDVEREFYWDGNVTFFDETISKEDFNVYTGANFTGSYFEDADYWNGEYITFDPGMSKVEFSLKTKTWSYLRTPMANLQPTLTNTNNYYWFPHGLQSLVIGMNNTKYTRLGVDLKNETQGTQVNVPIIVDSWNTPTYQNASQNSIAYYQNLAHDTGYAALKWKQQQPSSGTCSTQEELDYHFIIPEGFAQAGDQLYIHIYCSNEGYHSTTISGDAEPLGLLSCRKIGGQDSWIENFTVNSDAWLNGAPSLNSLGYDQVYIEDSVSPVNPRIDYSYAPGVATYLLINNENVYNHNQYAVVNNTNAPSPLIEPGSTYFFEDYFIHPIMLYTVSAKGAYSTNRIRYNATEIKCEWVGQEVIGQEEVEITIDGFSQYTEDVSHIINTEVTIEELKPINVSKENTEFLAQEGIPFSLINDFKFTLQLKEKDSNTVYYEWERAIQLAPFDNVDTSIWEQFNYFPVDSLLPIENYGIPSGTELEVTIKPESFRKFNNEFDGWIRLTRTNFVCAWRNNLYISNTELFSNPTKSHYWLHGDFVVKD